MCPCFVEGFYSSEAKYVKKLIHFYYKRNDEDEAFASTCKGHPFLFSWLEGMKSECDCKNMGLFEMCDFYVQIEIPNKLLMLQILHGKKSKMVEKLFGSVG